MLVISKKGKVLGVGESENVNTIKELVQDELGSYIDPMLNERLLNILSTKEKQFGFSAEFADGMNLCCLGDEPYNEVCEIYAQNADYLLSEAFCLYGDRDIFKPYEKHHSTVKEACELAEQLQVKNLILYHTEDKHIDKRKELYTDEGKQYYYGNLYVPDDLDVINLK